MLIIAAFTTFDSTISVANFVALLAVLVSLITLMVSARKDRNLRKTEYADQIRSSAAVLTAKLERWLDLALGLFEEIQPAITDADVALVKERDLVATRDKFWRDLGVARLAVSQRIRDEEIEIAYANLYGYDPKARKLFLTAIDHLKAIREVTHHKISSFTQSDILNVPSSEVSSARLGNRLRITCANVAATYAFEMSKVVEPFQREMTKIVDAKDDDIFTRSVALADAEALFPNQLQNPSVFDLLGPKLAASSDVAILCCHDGLERCCVPINDSWSRVDTDATDSDFGTPELGTAIRRTSQIDGCG